MVVDIKNGGTSIYERTPTLKRYFDDIRKYQVLSKEEEYALISVYKNGTEEEKKKAKEKIVNANYRFVVAVARRYGNDSNLMDLIQEGNEGLLEALEDYDLTKKVKFTSWAVWYIRRAMNIYNVNYGTIVKRNNIAKTYHLISKATNDFIQKENREPSSEELFDILNEVYDAHLKDTQDVTPTKINYIEEINRTEDNDVTNLNDMFTYNSYSASANDFETKANEDYTHKMISTLLNVLTPREQQIIKMAFGIGYFREYENQEIGEKLGMTSERIRQMKISIIKRLNEEYQKRLTEK